MKTMILLLLSLLIFTGCSSVKQGPTVQYIYKTKYKYVYLPCKEETTKNKDKESSPQKATQKKKQLHTASSSKKLTTPTLKYRQPTPTTIYAPKQFIIRPIQRMNFMVGINKDKSKFLYMEGEFDQNTYKEFLDFKKHMDSSIKEIKINSNGGIVLSAMKIGAFIKENGWSTGLDKEMHCYSACGFVYFAGKEKSIQGEAKIGLHRPYLPGVPDTMQSIQKIKKEYLSYWRYIKAPMDIYYEMMEVDRDDLLILDKNSLEEYMDLNILQ